MNRQPATHPFDEISSWAQSQQPPGDRPAERTSRKTRTVPPPRQWASVSDMPEYGITLVEAALHLGVSYASLWALASGGRLEAAIRAAGDWQPGMLLRRGSRWHLSRAGVCWLTSHNLPHIRPGAVGV